VNKPRPFPNYPNINYFTNGAGGNWRGLTLQVKRAYQNGLFFHAYYTRAQNIGDLDDDASPEDAMNRLRERGAMNDQPNNRFYATMIYALPFGKGKRFLSHMNHWVDGAIGGWQIANFGIREGGFLLSPAWTGPDPTGTRFTASTTPPTVTIRPDILANPDPDNPTIQRWYNPAAFAAPQPGAFGTSSRGVIIGPPEAILSSALQKYFSIRERAKLRVELMASNVLNHCGHLSNPDLNISNVATAGVITAAAPGRADGNWPRQVQIILRLEW
jgi:hypothetical protein